MDGEEKQRFVQQYVERQRAYLPTYTAEGLVHECRGTPARPSRSDAGFGFDTPVLRPRAPANTSSKPALQAGSSKTCTHKREPANQAPKEAPLPPSETRDTAQGKKDKTRSKRKKDATPNDTDNERAARLADRRERKRKKRAIVDPLQKDDAEIVPTSAPKKGKMKKPPALALLYGFSATNVTKDRLTLKPAPSLGVFSKGKASAKKKVVATKKSASRNGVFSEYAFLNKPSERAADPLKTDDDSDDSSTSSHPVAQKTRVTKPTRKDGGKCTEAPALKTSQVSNRTAAESEVWDIEVQSKLPSSACDVSSEPEAKESAPIVLDLRGAEWSASIQDGKRRNKTQTASLSVIQSRSILRSGSELGVELGHSHAADVSSLHPSHSASQYFVEPRPVSDKEVATNPPQTSRSDDDIDLPNPQDQDIQDVALGVQTRDRVASPISSLKSVPLRVAAFQTRYDTDLHELRSDSSPYDDFLGCVNAPWEPLGGLDHGYPESPIVVTRDDRFVGVPEYGYACQGDLWDWHASAGPATDDMEFEGNYDPLMFEDDLGDAEPVMEPHFFEPQAEYGAETRQESGVNGSICYSEESMGEAADFLEGRALLLGVHERRREGMSGLVEAEMDVANRLRDHWRPLRP